MAAGEEKGSGFYHVLGLKKECTALELKNAYKKLALKWHPDRCSASGNSKFVEESKKKFQAIQEAYSVLSDENKRFLYDVGVYENDDDDHGMGDFLNEMATMMTQTKTNENGEESFEELQELFEEMFKGDIDQAFGPTSSSSCVNATTSCSTSSYAPFCETSNSNHKRNSCQMNSANTQKEDSSAFPSHFQSFCLGAEQQQDSRKREGARGARSGGRRRNGRKQKVSSGHDVSSNEYSGIST